MSYPTVHAKPFFDTMGFYTSVYVDVMNNPPTGTAISKIRIWLSSTDDLTCINRRTTGAWMTVPNPMFSGTTSMWSDYFPNPPPNFLWDSALQYLCVCVEVTLNPGPTVYKGGLWEQVLEGDYAVAELMDCGTNLIPVPKSQVIPIMTEGDLQRLGKNLRFARKINRARKGRRTKKS